MKIGIVTYAKCDNYGAELQAYALQWKLNQMGYDAELIDLEKKEKDLASNKASIIPAIRNRFKVYGWKAPWEIMKLCFDVLQRKISAKENETNQEEKHKLFIEFFEKNIRHSAKHYTLEEIRTTKDLDYDVYIAGSDQIWNTDCPNGHTPGYYLDFGTAKKISYAASFAVSKVADEWKPFVKQQLSHFDHISVREKTGLKILEDLGIKGGELVVDPVFLLTESEWSKLAGGAKNYGLEDGKYILIYDFLNDDRIAAFAHKLSKELGLPTIGLNDYNVLPYVDRNIKDAGPLEFLSLIKHAAVVVSSSFHATVFSLIFQKSFYVFPLKNTDNSSRMIDLLQPLNISSRFMPTDVLPDIEYGDISKKLEVNTNSSKEILIDFINK